ncbi:pre-toxin TG domain-containing protein [Kroppenstedtia eburnea]|uniref:pre-toxin TG domain-containing protein n=1 Tax=Kroppenstedtia eburnea TaxID=714067 RepID=UPI0036304BF4
MGDRWNDVKDFTKSAWDGTKEFVSSVWDDAVDYVTDTGEGGLLDDALDTVGVTSAYEFITGKDWYTGEELSTWDRTGGAIIDFIIAKKAKKVGKGLGYLDKKLLGGNGTKFVSDAYQFGSKKLDHATSALKKKLCNCKLDDQIKSLEKKLSKSEGKGYGDPTEKSIRRKKEKLEKEKKHLEKQKEKAKREEERKKKKAKEKEELEQRRQKHGKLAKKYDENGKKYYESPSGLIYDDNDRKFKNRVEHVMAHGKPNPKKREHSVFKGGKKDILAIVDEAWSKRGEPSSSTNKREIYEIYMGEKIGTKGEKTVRIVVDKGTSRVVTAYPLK